MRNWKSTLDVSNVWKKTKDGTIDTSTETGFKQFIDEFKPLIRNSSQYKNDTDFRIVANKVLNSRSLNQFNSKWNELYDYCDFNSIWIKTY